MKRQSPFAREKLENKDSMDSFQLDLSNSFHVLQKVGDIEDQWDFFKRGIKESAEVTFFFYGGEDPLKNSGLKTQRGNSLMRGNGQRI